MKIPIFKKQIDADEILSSVLCDENNFYDCLIEDFRTAKVKVVIESPFMTVARVTTLIQYFQDMRLRGVTVSVRTRHPNAHEYLLRQQALESTDYLKNAGVVVKYVDYTLHRKLVIIDNDILWEGSLNVLSQKNSGEMMRRISSKALVSQTRDYFRI